MKKLLKFLGGALAISLAALVLEVTPIAPHVVRADHPDRVIIANTPLAIQGIVAASQNGTWNVGINGTPTVNVANLGNIQLSNTAANPLNVRDIDNPALQPFSLIVGCQFQNGECDTNVFTVPNGKVLVIEDFSGSCSYSGTSLSEAILISDQRASNIPAVAKAQAVADITNTPVPSGQIQGIFGRALRLYAQPGESVSASMESFHGVTSGLCRANLNGYLVNQ